MILSLWYCRIAGMLRFWYCRTVVMLSLLYCRRVVMLSLHYCRTVVMISLWYCRTVVMISLWYCRTVLMLSLRYFRTVVMLSLRYWRTVVCSILLKTHITPLSYASRVAYAESFLTMYYFVLLPHSVPLFTDIKMYLDYRMYNHTEWRLEEKNSRHAILRQKANCIGHIFHRDCFLKHIIEGHIEVMGRRWRRRKQLLDNLKRRDDAGKWEMKQ